MHESQRLELLVVLDNCPAVLCCLLLVFREENLSASQCAHQNTRLCVYVLKTVWLRRWIVWLCRWIYESAGGLLGEYRAI